jgi:hypothetical protein
LKFIPFKIGDGATIKFWSAIWCGDRSLKEAYPKFFLIAHINDALVADHLQFQNDSIHWDLDFTHPVQDRELESITSFWICCTQPWSKGMVRIVCVGIGLHKRGF